MPGKRVASRSPIHRATGVLAALLLAGGAGLAGTAQADILRLEDGSFTIKERESVPTRGQTKETVRGRYGEPATRHPTVGEPPITRWDYDSFSVVFEDRWVIHTIVHGNDD